MATAIKRTIHIFGNWRKGGPDSEWAGSGTVDQYGAIECAANLDGDAYDQIEAAIEDGFDNGEVTVQADDDQRAITYRWNIDA